MLATITNALLLPTIQFVYFLNEKLYSLILTLGDINLFRNGKFDDLNKRIFIFAGIFMLFKLAISVINYVLDPDKITNAQTGAQKIIMKLMIALALLTAYDAVFTQAMKLQQLVLEDGILTKIVFGGTCGDGALDDVEKQKLTSNYISYTMIAPFIHYNDSAFEAESDIPEGCDNDQHQTPFVQVLGNMDICNPSTSQNTSLGYEGGDKCYEALWADDIKNENYSTLTGVRQVYRESFEEALLKYDFYKAWTYVGSSKKNGEAVFRASLLTPLLAFVVAIILFIICFRVAIRAVKLAFLRVIAPIPIISYVDLNNGDKGMFKKWLNTTISTYLELFVQLLALYFAIFIISQFIGNGSLTGFSGKVYSWSSNPFLNILMIVACFMFALQIPKLIQDITGLNTSGISKVTDSIGKTAKGLATGAAGAIGAGAIGAVANTALGIGAGINHFRDFNKKGLYVNADGSEMSGGQKAARAVGNVLAGAAGGFIGGGLNSARAGFKNNQKGLSAGNVLKGVEAGAKKSTEQRAANWTLQHEIEYDANGNIVYDANGKIKYKTTRKTGLLSMVGESIARPIAEATNGTTRIQDQYKSEKDAYEAEESKLRMEASQLKAEYDSKTYQINKQSTLISQAESRRTGYESKIVSSTSKIGDSRAIYTSMSTDDGTVAYKLRHVAETGGLNMNLSAADLQNGTFGVTIEDGFNTYDLSTMSYSDYTGACSILGVSAPDQMSKTEFEAVQKDYKDLLNDVNTNHTNVQSTITEIHTLETDKTIMENSLTATRDAITQNNTKLTNVTKAKAGSAKDSGKIDTSLKG